MPKFEGLITSKLPAVGTTIFSVMSKLAIENNAINLSQGFPDFNCSDKLIELVNHYMQKGFNQSCAFEYLWKPDVSLYS